MNSLGDTVLRRGERKGAGGDEQGNKKKDQFTSGGEVNSSAEAGRNRRKGKKGTRDTEVSVEEAFAALQRATREPFTAEESEIAGADDATAKFDSNHSSDVEILMEELPPGKIPPGILVGHRGWVVGNDSGEEEEDEHPEAKEGQKASKPGFPRASRGRVGAGRAQPAVKRTMRDPRGKTGRQKDQFALSDDGGECGGARGVREGYLGEELVPPKLVGGRRVGGSAEGERESPSPETGPPAEGAAWGSSEAGTPMGLNARLQRSEPKATGGETVMQERSSKRREGGTLKATHRGREAFEEWVDGLRRTNPYQPTKDKSLIWARSATHKALEAVGVTYDRWEASAGTQRKLFGEAVVAWLEANKSICSLATRPLALDTDVTNADVSGDVEEEPSKPEAERAREERAAFPTEKSQEIQSSDGGGDEAENSEPPLKRAKVREEERTPRSPRAERRYASQEEQRRNRRARKEGLDKSKSITPKGLGRSKQAELDKHKRLTKKRERAKREVRELIEASLLQQRRQERGKKLTVDEQQLAAFAKTLSPTKLLGSGLRLTADGQGSVEGEDEEVTRELMEETGCERQLALEALDLSRGWTGSGRPSTLKAAQWLLAQREADNRDEDEEEEEGGSENKEDVKFVSHCSPGGTSMTASGGGRATGGAGREAAAVGGGCRRDGRSAAEDHDDEEERVPKVNRKTVSKTSSRKPKDDESVEEGSASDGDSSLCDSSSGGSLVESLSSVASSDSDGSNSSDSEEERAIVRDAKKRDARGGAIPSRRVSHSSEAKRASRYARQLELALNIDACWARELYEECATQGTTSYDGLLRYFYRHEVQHAKGTHRETARALGGEQQRSSSVSGEISVNMPTFQLPEWGPGQPPNGGVHFSTLQKMLEAYEKYDKQTNFKTQVTFKSMVRDMLKPNFESKCKLPETVWLPPREDDWMRVAEGKPERGGWSDMRFLRRVRRVLRPKGRTNYEIAFEEMTLRHRGNEEQLAVNLDLWGTKWLAKEREATDEGKALPALKMKSYFKKAVAGVPRFRRWLEGRTFVSCKDWYGVLCRKLHRTLGQHAEAAYDKEREGEHREHGGYSRGGGVYRGGYGGSGSGVARGGGAYRGGRGGGATEATTGTTRSSRWGEKFDGKNSDADSRARLNAHTVGVGISPHSGGMETMHSESPAQRHGDVRGGRGVLRGIRRVTGGTNRQVNSTAEETKEKLPKGPRWHDSKMASLRCRDPDCGTRQDVPFCQGCGLHGHDRPFCYKAGEPLFNPSGYWCINRPNENPIDGLGKRREGSAPIAMSRSNMLDASPGL
jgi:hypothetical protein